MEVVGWGWQGATAVVKKKHMRKLDHQMDSNEVLLSLKYHKKQPNQWLIRTANHFSIYGPVPVVKGHYGRFKAIQALLYAWHGSESTPSKSRLDYFC